ncbi:hypothetical protein EJD97_005081, partial [Solanum chilense]
MICIFSYHSFTFRFENEALSLPLSGIKVVLSSDLLQIASEDAVYDFALKWARMHYPKFEDRRQLKEIMTCNDFGSELASKFVFEALYYKAEEPYQQRAMAAKLGNALGHRYVERAYKLRPVKALEFEAPHQHSVVYLDLKREECAILFPEGKLCSQVFHLGRQELFLSAHCNREQSEPIALDYEFSVRLRPDNEFLSMYKGSHTLNNGIVVGCRNLCDISWTPFLNE